MKTAPSVEPLEPRIAPAALAGHALSYTDIDGDKVAITISKGTLTAGAFTFDTGTVDGTTTTPQHLKTIDLSGISDAAGAAITMKVPRAGNGDGLADIDHIIATGLNLGAVSIAGNLLEIDAGKGDVDLNAIASLKVRSFGQYADPASGGGLLVSSLGGGLGSLTVTGDFQFVHLDVTGTIGPITIGGTLRGGAVTDAGSITNTYGNMGAVKIGGDLLGGSGFGSGSITCTDGDFAGVTVGGSVIGAGPNSARLTAGSYGVVKIGGDWRGGSGDDSANLTGSVVTRFILGGSLIGGSGDHSGWVNGLFNIGAVQIGHDLLGGSGPSSGRIVSTSIASFSLGGSLIGGSANDAGSVKASMSLGPITVGGDLVGGSALQAGSIISDGAGIPRTAVNIGGSILGGSATKTGYLSLGNMATVRVGHDLRGGGGANSAEIFITSIASASIGGSIVGGGSSFSGALIASDTLGITTIGGNVRGGAGANSGLVQSDNAGITGLTIGGSLIGGDGDSSGLVFAPGDIGKITIKGDLRASTNAAVTDAGEIFSDNGSIKGVSISGSAIGGPGAFSGSILAENLLGPVSVKGGVTGFAPDKPFTIRGGGTHTGTDFAISSFTVGGSVTNTLVLGGFGFNNSALDGAVQIGPVKVGRDWIASSLSAGVQDVMGNGYGTSDDARIGAIIGNQLPQKSRIVSIAIGGIVSGTQAGGDNYGFDAEQFGPIKINGGSKTPAGVPLLVAPVTKDVFIFKPV